MKQIILTKAKGSLKIFNVPIKDMQRGYCMSKCKVDGQLSPSKTLSMKATNLEPPLTFRSAEPARKCLKRRNCLKMGDDDI